MWGLILKIPTINLKSIVLSNNGIFENRSKWGCKQFLKLGYGECNDKFRNYQEVGGSKQL